MHKAGMNVGQKDVYWVILSRVLLSLSLSQSERMDKLQLEMKNQEQQLEDVDAAKRKITVSVPEQWLVKGRQSHIYLVKGHPINNLINFTGTETAELVAV